MKNLTILLILFVIISCKPEIKERKLTYKRTVVSGKVLNFNRANNVNLYVNRLGLPSKLVNSEIDSLGNFSMNFELYMPTDAWLEYNTSFLILLHPGDSLYVEFDGKFQERPDVLKTMIFKGDGSKINQEAAAFQYMYFSSDLFAERETKYEYEMNEFQLYLDTLKLKSRQMFEKFVTDISPDNETKAWALTMIEQHYYDVLSFYPGKHPVADNLKSKDGQVPPNYYNPILERLPLKTPLPLSTFDLNNFISVYNHDYVEKHISDESFIINFYNYLLRDINVSGIIKYTSDTLLRQLVLTRFFSKEFERNEVKHFEKCRKMVDKYIQEPYLKEPLIELYNQTKQRIEKPKVSTEVILNKLESSSLAQIMDSILINNKGNVVYVDCWATWCGPCRTEMPHSKKLMKLLQGKNVSFVYICIDSEEKLWKASLDQFQLSGQQYFLTKKQSSELRETFEANAVPYYILFDKNGTIVEKGTHLRPDQAKEKIEKLLR